MSVQEKIVRLIAVLPEKHKKILHNYRKILFFLLILLIGLSFYGVLIVLQHKKPEIAKTGILKPLVVVETVQRQDMMKRIVLSGQTVAGAQVDIAAKYGGHISQVNVELGQVVTAGQVLIQQDTSDLDLSIAQTEAAMRQAKAKSVEANATYDANYLKAEAELQRAQASFQRYESLYNQGAVSREAYDLMKQQMLTAKSSYDVLTQQIMAEGIPAVSEIQNAALAETKYSLEALRKKQEDMQLKAPRSGIIGYRQAEVGALVQASQKLLTVVDNSVIYIDCELSEQEAAQVKTGMKLEISVVSLGKKFAGDIIYVSPTADAKTQAFNVRIMLKQEDSLIRGGMFAKATIETLLRPQTLFVSKEGLLEKNGKQYMFVVLENGKIEQRQVKTGLRNDTAVEILSGIREGEQVAVSNVSRLKQDMLVEAAGNP